MNILCVGDVVGMAGCAHLRRLLPVIKRRYAVDVCIVNGENADDGNGLTPTTMHHLFDSGADVITGGNHSFRRKEIYDHLDNTPALLRPANYPPTVPGHGWYWLDRGRYRVAVINLMGVAFLEPLADPFETLDRLLAEAGNPRFCIVDFHAEATAEKEAFGYYADGRVSAVVGTHTHVPTADAHILPGGTAYITDVGMTGPHPSVLGVKTELAIQKMRQKIPVRFQVADTPCRMDCLLITVDDHTGRATAVQQLMCE